MAPVPAYTYTRLHGRFDAVEYSANSDTTSTLTLDSNPGFDPAGPGPGQRISVDGGIDFGGNIIAMILATVLFIVVVTFYQYMALEMARREQEARSNGAQTRGRRVGERRRSRPRSRSWSGATIKQRISAVVKRWISFARLIVSPPKTPTAAPARSTSKSKSDSMDTLLKVRPLRPPKRRGFANLNLPCLSRRKESPSSSRYSKKDILRGTLRPLLLNQDSSYVPRSPIDTQTRAILRSPDAFAEYADPVRSMHFMRMQDEFQRRKERDGVQHDWLGTAVDVDVPKKPGIACVAPLVFRRARKIELVREVKVKDVDREYISEWAPPSPDRVSYPSCEQVILQSATPPSQARYVPPYSPHQLSIIDEETEIESEPPTPHSFFEFDDEELQESSEKAKTLKGLKVSVRKRIRLRFPLPSPAKSSFQKDVDTFTIGSFSASEGSCDSFESRD